MTDNLPTVITVDGPGGSGKGTVTQMLAKKLGFHLLDSGALYRLTALAAVRQGVSLEDEATLIGVAASLDVAFEPTPPGEPAKVILAGEDVTSEIRTETCGDNASRVLSCSRFGMRCCSVSGISGRHRAWSPTVVIWAPWYSPMLRSRSS